MIVEQLVEIVAAAFGQAFRYHWEMPFAWFQLCHECEVEGAAAEVVDQHTAADVLRGSHMADRGGFGFLEQLDVGESGFDGGLLQVFTHRVRRHDRIGDDDAGDGGVEVFRLGVSDLRVMRRISAIAEKLLSAWLTRV